MAGSGPEMIRRQLKSSHQLRVLLSGRSRYKLAHISHEIRRAAMKRILTILVGLALVCVFAIRVRAQSQTTALSNQDIVAMVKAGLPTDIVVAKIAASQCNFDTSPAALEQLKSQGIPSAIILAMIQASTKNASIPGNEANGIENLAQLFTKFQNAVVTVWSEFGHGTGFIVDRRGLILTNQHVIGPSEVNAVQFDATHKIRAVLLAADPDKDIAVLWANITAFPGAQVAPVIASGSGAAPVVVGERVFTIGSPLSQRKIMTTGIVSGVDSGAIISDIDINPGNSGGPLFNSMGYVIGLTTFNEQGSSGRGISGIIRIEQTRALLEQAKAKISNGSHPPDPALLPVEPTDSFPLDAIKAAALAKKFDTRPYFFSEGDYDVALITPILKYHIEEQGRVTAAREKSRRTRREGAVQGTFQPLEDLKTWAEYAGEYQPVIQIQADPKLRETFMSAFSRGLAQGAYVGPAKMRFKTDFYKMHLLCGDKEIQPIQPSKVADVLNVHSSFVSVTDATYQGFYTYPPDAISPACGKVVLELYSEKDPNKPTVKVLNPKTIDRIWGDFEAYRASHGDQTKAHSSTN